MAHASNPSYSGGSDREDCSSKAASCQDPISRMNWAWWSMPVIPATQGGIGRKVTVQGPGKNVRLD
jgi:hypothetical protein